MADTPFEALGMLLLLSFDTGAWLGLAAAALVVVGLFPTLPAWPGPTGNALARTCLWTSDGVGEATTRGLAVVAGAGIAVVFIGVEDGDGDGDGEARKAGTVETDTVLFFPVVASEMPGLLCPATMVTIKMKMAKMATIPAQLMQMILERRPRLAGGAPGAGLPLPAVSPAGAAAAAGYNGGGMGPRGISWKLLDDDIFALRMMDFCSKAFGAGSRSWHPHVDKVSLRHLLCAALFVP